MVSNDGGLGGNVGVLGVGGVGVMGVVGMIFDVSVGRLVGSESCCGIWSGR